VNKNQRI